MTQFYIRFGEIPDNERSGVYNGEEKLAEEVGVSVYDCIQIDGQWRIVLPALLVKIVGFDLYNFIQRHEYNRSSTSFLPMYLVTGDKVGHGSTNEPLLHNVKIIQEL